jgi:DNA-binding protein HU-beta
MNKSSLVEAVKSKMEGTKKEAEMAVSAVLQSISEGMVTDGKVALVGFGSFEAVDRKARTCKNPQNGETINVPAKVAPRFKASTAMKDISL